MILPPNPGAGDPRTSGDGDGSDGVALQGISVIAVMPPSNASAREDARLRRAANARGLRLSSRGTERRILDSERRVLHTGDTESAAKFLAGRPHALNYRRKDLPPDWVQPVEDYLLTLAAAGRREATLRTRRSYLSHMARELGVPPDAVTADHLVDWFGRQTHWALETRRGYRNAARSFFSWAYRAGRAPVYLGDDLPSVRQHKGPPRPTPDDAWRSALAAADPRTKLMLRLAGEAGLRRAEVAQVHTGDLLEYPGGGTQLMVHGKGGKKRVVPIADELADLLQQGAAGHTPGMPAEGWLFPDGAGGHLKPYWVGMLVSGVLPDGYTMHTLRHRFATRAYRGTRNLRAVQTLLGHESIATTERYTAVDDDEIRAAASAAW